MSKEDYKSWKHPAVLPLPDSRIPSWIRDTWKNSGCSHDRYRKNKGMCLKCGVYGEKSKPCSGCEDPKIEMKNALKKSDVCPDCGFEPFICNISIPIIRDKEFAEILDSHRAGLDRAYNLGAALCLSMYPSVLDKVWKEWHEEKSCEGELYAKESPPGKKVEKGFLPARKATQDLSPIWRDENLSMSIVSSIGCKTQAEKGYMAMLKRIAAYHDAVCSAEYKMRHNAKLQDDIDAGKNTGKKNFYNIDRPVKKLLRSMSPPTAMDRGTKSRFRVTKDVHLRSKKDREDTSNNWKSISFNQDCNYRREDNTLLIPKVGRCTLKYRIPEYLHINPSTAVTIVDETKKCTSKTKPEHRKLSAHLPMTLFLDPARKIAAEVTKTAVSVDAGGVIVAFCSDGQYLPVGVYAEMELKADQMQSARDNHLRKGSRAWQRTTKEIADIREEARRIRKGTHDESAQYLVSGYDAIFTENLQLKNMRRSPRGTIENPGTGVKAAAKRNRKMSTAAPGYFLAALRWQASKQGKQHRQVNPAYTSQRCSVCEHVDKKSRETQARYICVDCLIEIHGDFNGACNVYDKACESYEEFAHLLGRRTGLLSVDSRIAGTCWFQQATAEMLFPTEHRSDRNKTDSMSVNIQTPTGKTLVSS